MPTRSVQPFFHSHQVGNAFALGATPYNSRVESQELGWSDDNNAELVGAAPKNYQMVAFRPGFPLQASELNEIQEHMMLQMTLHTTMMHNWITSGPGPIWSGHDAGSAGYEGGTQWNSIDSPQSGIGLGGGIDQTNPDGAAIHTPQYAVSAPGWMGSCPLYPFGGPYSNSGLNGGPNGRMVSVTQAGQNITISVHSGWWLMEPRYTDQLESNPPDLTGVSGLKHWVFLDTVQDGLPQWQQTINVADQQADDIVIGLNVGTDYYSCCPEADGTPELPCDPNLGDNSAVPNGDPVSCGAGRFGVYATGVDSVNLSAVGSEQEKQKLSLFCKVNPQEKTVRYMNNLLLYKWS
tara:strand:+ start:2329 stop:3375 length:1047 start_codon:yes stop_codon:yes gene_type:complete